MADDFVIDDPTLVDPDGEEQAKYSWDEEFQRHIIALLVSDRQFLLSSIDLVRSSYFTNRAHQKMCQLVFDFFKRYRLLPKKDFIVQELKEAFKDNKSLAYYLGEVNVVYDYFQPGLDAREYLQDKITYFAKIQSLKKAFHNSLKEIDKNPEKEETWEKIYEMMREAMTTQENFDLGIDYFRTLKDRYAQQEEDYESEDRFITGMESWDKEVNNGGYSRGEIISIVAGSGVGKSVCLACIAGTNLMRGKRGVYISCELKDTKVADRMDAILSGFPISCLVTQQDDLFEKLANLDGVDYECGMPFVIKQFPAGTATVNKIRAYLSQLRFHGFDPDFIVVDYVGEMKPIAGLPTHESREQIVRDLRGMAEEEQVFVATAMQPNRGSRETQKSESGRIEEEHLADSFGQIRPLDGCISLNQNDNEQLLGIGRAYKIKERDGKSRYQFYLKFDKNNLRISEISHEKYREALSAHKEYVSEEVKVDQVVTGWAPDEESEENQGEA